VQNVVTYIVIINVDNQDLRLKPGMTANVSIETGRRDGVLKVPAAALRFKPRSDKETKKEQTHRSTGAKALTQVKRAAVAAPNSRSICLKKANRNRLRFRPALPMHGLWKSPQVLCRRGMR